MNLIIKSRQTKKETFGAEGLTNQQIFHWFNFKII